MAMFIVNKVMPIHPDHIQNGYLPHRSLDASRTSLMANEIVGGFVYKCYESQDSGKFVARSSIDVDRRFILNQKRACRLILLGLGAYPIR